MSGISVKLSENKKPENLLDAQGCVLVFNRLSGKASACYYREGKDQR